MGLLEKLENLLSEASYDDASYSLLKAKTKVHNQEVYLQDLKRKAQDATSTTSKEAFRKRIAQEQEDLKKYKDYVRAAELNFSAAKIKKPYSEPNRPGASL